MTFDLRFYWTLFLRRLPLMAAVFLLCAGIGVALAIKLPTVYASSAQLLIEDPQIQGLQGGQAGGAEQLDDIQRRLLTRANLIDIANNRDVFADKSVQDSDSKLKAMREATDIKRFSGRDRATGMIIQFEASNPRVARDVVDDYVTLIEAENARQRERLTGNTLAFFEQQVDRLSEELNDQSQLIVDFKSDNTNALPETLEYRLDRQGQLQERVALIDREMANLREQRDRIQRIFETTGSIRPAQQQQLSPNEQRLAQLRAELKNLQLVYSDTHPRVRALLGQVAQAETLVAAEGGSAAAPETSQDAIFEITMAEIDSKMESLEGQRAQVAAEVDNLGASINQTAANGIVLADLERDYANAQAQYNAALARRDQAQIDQNANSSQLGQRIIVLESPSIPNSPSSPNRPLIAGGGVAAGLAAMAALFMLLEALNRTIRRPVELTSALGVTPLATIPHMETRRRFWVRRALKLALLAVVVIGVPVALWVIDTYYRPLELISDRLLRQLGF